MAAKKAKTGTKSKAKLKTQPLTTKQKKFTEAYLANGFNATDAARKAGYKGNDNTLAQAGRQNLRKPQIEAKILERIEEAAATADEVLGLLGAHLRADIADFDGCFDSEGRLNLKEARARKVSRLVRKMRTYSRKTVREDGAEVSEVTTQIELHDSQSAARTLVEVLNLKQQSLSSVEQSGTEQVKQVAQDEMARLVREGWKPEIAQAIVVEAEPTAMQWLQ
jgi:phage terminase small subunit